MNNSMIKLDVVMITKNSSDVIDDALSSVRDLADEIIVVDDYSTDKTVEIAKRYGASIYHRHNQNLGKQRWFGIQNTKNNWVLLLDADERVSPRLQKEIQYILSKPPRYEGFTIPFRNHFLGRVLRYGGENYKKLRLFNKKSRNIHMKETLVHEELQLNTGGTRVLTNSIDHYSYRSLAQMYSKFTDYALREAIQKRQKAEKTSMKKIVLYPLHMFWARFIVDEGYKDGWFRIPLDLGFAYMEFLTYVTMLFIKKTKET